jgi:hypothetical protein
VAQGVQRIRARAEGGEQQEHPGVDGGQFTPVLDGQRGQRLVHREVGERHRARAEQCRRPGEQTQQDQDSADQVNDPGPPRRPRSHRHGAALPAHPAQHTENAGQAVADKHEGDNHPHGRQGDSPDSFQRIPHHNKCFLRNSGK